MSTTASSPYEAHTWSAPSAFPKLHSRAREAETARCAEFTFTKSLERIEIPQCIYDSRIGLGLLSKDPIGFAAGDTNLYRMTGNHPNMSNDPSGLFDDGLLTLNLNPTKEELQSAMQDELASMLKSQEASSAAFSEKMRSTVVEQRVLDVVSLYPHLAPKSTAEAERLSQNHDLYVGAAFKLPEDELRSKVDSKRREALQVQRIADIKHLGVVAVSMFVKPVDWTVTAYQIYKHPTSWSSYIGLIPMVPAAAGRLGRSADDLADATHVVAPIKGGFGVNGQIGSLPTGAESSILKGLYLDQVNSNMFGVKLGIHNTIKKVTTLGQSKWVSRSDIRGALETQTSFRVGASTVHHVGDGFVVGGRESLGYLNRTVSHHEMMHIGQYIRNPNLIDTRPFGYIHEVIPSYVGTPEIYGGGTIIIGGGLYWWLNSGDN